MEGAALPYMPAGHKVWRLGVSLRLSQPAILTLNIVEVNTKSSGYLLIQA